jgi:hypothetical protein
VAVKIGKPSNVSTMHTWARYHHPDMSLAAAANLGKALAPFDDWPYDGKLAALWASEKEKVDQPKLARADEQGTVKLAAVHRLPVKSDELKAQIAAGQDVWFAIRGSYILNHLQKSEDGTHFVPDYEWDKPPVAGHKGAHAIVLAGYKTVSDGAYFLIHNSWGEKWGDKGYAWIHGKTLEKNVSAAYTIEVDVPGALVKNHQLVTCAPDLLPDSATGDCVPACEGGGPRHGGVCPLPGHCPSGEVNLYGECVLAAPTKKGSENGLVYACAPSGCTYTIQRGKYGCKDAAGCHLSCPSPSFRLSSQVDPSQAPTCME